MKHIRLLAPALLACMAVGCQRSPTAAPASHVAGATRARLSSTPEAAGAGPNHAGGGALNSLNAFVPQGHRVVDRTDGALMGGDAKGTVLVTEPITAAATADDERAGRSVVLVTAGNDGPVVVGRNDRIVPCATCGGVAGDPYADTEIGDGRFTLVIEGGSRERWSAAYTFAYESGARRFVLERAKRRVVDTLTDAQARSDVDPQDFGVITFDDFDPAQLGDAPTLAAE